MGAFPSTLKKILSHNSSEDPPSLHKFHAAVDDSDYSLNDWTEALLEFDNWLESRNIEARPFNAMVGYVRCCAMMPPADISLPSLKVIVNQSLIEFGFDAVSTYHS